MSIMKISTYDIILPKSKDLKQTHLMEAQVVLYSWRRIKHVTFGGDHQHKAIEGLKTKLDRIVTESSNRVAWLEYLRNKKNRNVIFGLFYTKHSGWDCECKTVDGWG